MTLELLLNYGAFNFIRSLIVRVELSQLWPNAYTEKTSLELSRRPWTEVALSPVNFQLWLQQWSLVSPLA